MKRTSGKGTHGAFFLGFVACATTSPVPFHISRRRPASLGRLVSAETRRRRPQAGSPKTEAGAGAGGLSDATALAKNPWTSGSLGGLVGFRIEVSRVLGGFFSQVKSPWHQRTIRCYFQPRPPDHPCTLQTRWSHDSIKVTSVTCAEIFLGQRDSDDGDLRLPFVGGILEALD